MRGLLTGLSCCLFVVACGDASTEPQAEPAGTINVYSARHYDSDRQMYDTFEEQTGIRVRFREMSSSQLLETMRAEGDASPADIVIAADAGTLWRFQDAGLLRAVESDALNAAIPEKFREPEGYWFGLAKRARVIAYDPERLSEDQIGEYGQLADESLEGELCMRSSSNIYNLSLMSELIERWGEDEAAEWVNAVQSNFARDPRGGDTTQIESIAAGEFSAALVNHYYWVRMLTSRSEDRRALAEATALAFPETGDGTHVNITGAGVAANAPNAEAAIAFIEFLVSERGQELLVSETKEFPMVDGVALPDGLEALPEFIESAVALTKLGENQATAQTLYDRAGWN
ncbi:MAG: extracellular solute-binding protein [Pseudomonadota bacterium]